MYIIRVTYVTLIHIYKVLYVLIYLVLQKKTVILLKLSDSFNIM